MGHHSMDNGDAFLRAAREGQQQANNQYGGRSGGFSSIYGGYARHDPPTAGEQFEPEDVTGLKMLDEFLAKRKQTRDE